ncbi:MAG: hypothetical protein CSA62_04595 [Planctomycetota bacterium]|nr:MAG: hypothetical protein CSA62_04595 [Planctomycetota bacterium]
MRFLPSLLLVFLASCASGPKSVPKVVGLGDLAGELAKSDLVFFGEEHDNLLGHQQRFLLFQQLHARRPDMILSMEMFARDVQEPLNQYLEGKIDEKSFLAKAKPWPQYAQRYRPFVEYARRHGLAVLAANAPRSMVRKMRKEGWEAIAKSPWVPRHCTAPKDLRWTKFKEAMSGHMSVSEENLYKYYQAQCLWDDCMAESIVDALAAARKKGRSPLVVHLVGKFHVEDQGGTLVKVLERMPELDAAVLTMRSQSNIARQANGDWLLTLPLQPKPKMPRGHGKKKPTSAAK